MSEIHSRMCKFRLKAMRRWCQKLKAGLTLRKKAVRERRVESADCHRGRRRFRWIEGTLFRHFSRELGDQHNSLAFAPRAAWSPAQASAGAVPRGAAAGDSLTLVSGDAASQGGLPHFCEAPTSGASPQRALPRREAVLGSGLRGTRRTTGCGLTTRSNVSRQSWLAAHCTLEPVLACF